MSRSGSRAGSNLISYVVAARDHHVVEGAEGERAVHRMERPCAPVNEQHLVGRRIPVELGLRLGRAAAAKHHVVVGQKRDAAADHVAPAADRAGLEVMVPEDRLRGELQRRRPDRLDLRTPASAAAGDKECVYARPNPAAVTTSS